MIKINEKGRLVFIDVAIIQLFSRFFFIMFLLLSFLFSLLMGRSDGEMVGDIKR
jgi:hypothetical protein